MKTPSPVLSTCVASGLNETNCTVAVLLGANSCRPGTELVTCTLPSGGRLRSWMRPRRDASEQSTKPLPLSLGKEKIISSPLASFLTHGRCQSKQQQQRSRLPA